MLLAGHCGCFIPAVSLTTVASAVALVAMQPAWAALILRVRGERMAGLAWVGVGLAICGALLLSGVDVTVSGKALLGGRAGAGGRRAGRRLRGGGRGGAADGVDPAYTAVCYPVAAVALLAVCVASGQALGGYFGLDVVAAGRAGAARPTPRPLGVQPRPEDGEPDDRVGGAALRDRGRGRPGRSVPGPEPTAAAVPAAAVIALGTFLVIRASEKSPAVSGTPPVD